MYRILTEESVRNFRRYLLLEEKSTGTIQKYLRDVKSFLTFAEAKKQIEKELKDVLSKVRGVGECEVMVTVEETTEYVYAENLTKSTDNNGDRTSDRYENEIVITDNDGKKEALVRKIIKPQICGVVIVCEGGGDIKVNERVLKAVSTVLGISSSKICVEGRK